jgi:hypothetical protein
MISKKTVTIEVTEKELDALEDLLFSELSGMETDKATEQLKELWQKMVTAYDQARVRPMSNLERLDLQRAKRNAKPPVFKPGEYRLSYFLHQLEIGEAHFIKKSDWVSNKSPSERLARINKTTKKDFVISRKGDGSGWWVTREY